ncbi:MFS transporter [Acuticoccus sp. M5D2P5]|uniref:MFS transporter n=1 Tax=Acuticoccus kalidii TaxID=2910977 RepID=UPI001F4611DB|nr:MFS transporter [Acuticoccus kalidii]MCF3935145.1 MFS transporter [Acuticoccus kalidii]
MTVTARPSAAPGAFAPFGHVAFTVLWIATVASNVGTWMHDVGAAWLMTELSPSPLVVAAVQASTTLPMFLFALFAGAVADIVDRRKLILVVNIALAGAAVALATLTASGVMTPALLLAFTFAFGTGAAFIAPAWQAIVPQLVPREALTSAIALNSMGINAARAIGPAMAGVLIVAAGVAAPFAANAVSYAGIVVALLWWRPPPRAENMLPRERLGGALVGGLRFAFASRALKATLVRAAAFFLFASAYWAMLPLVARFVLDGGPGLYGSLMGAAGAGAVAGALVMPRLKARLGADGLVAAGTLGMAATLVVFALVHEPAAAIAASLVAGASWIAVLANLNVSAQTALPDWVRARGLSVFITVFFGSMTVGSLAWGQVANAAGISMALLAAAAGAVIAIPLTWRFKLMQGAQVDHTASAHWPEPIVSDSVEPDRGPVLVTVEYDVDPDDAPAFVAAMAEVREERRRHGAIGWSLHQDVAAPHLWLETFRHGSWLEHQRQHARVSHAEADTEALARAHHRGAEPPRVRHLLAPAATRPLWRDGTS